MRSLLGGLAAVTCLLLCLPATGAAAAASVPVSPSCATGPVRVGDTTYGTPCDDVIVAPAGVETVRGGAGNDTIVAAPIAAAIASCPSVCFLGVGSQTFEGGPGDDIVFGQRGNDTLLGGEGNDQLFGGIGDDLLRGGPGNDRLAGGFGADFIDGEAGDDYVHGDGTIDRIYDSGGGTDTLSFASGITPGFGAGAVEKAGYSELLPPSAERGVFLNLASGGENGNNGIAALGGGVDVVGPADFETVIGTPFSDYIVGTGGQEIYGGGGADVILGTGSSDGGADGDSVDPGGVVQRDQSKVSVGFMTPAGVSPYSQLYLAGSSDSDSATVNYSAEAVTIDLATDTFDQSGSAAAAGCSFAGTRATCPLAAPLDSIVLAGMGGSDMIAINGFPSSTTVVELGGDGGDSLGGGVESEDVLVDGPDGGADVLTALGGDDALLHNGGADQLFAGAGNDLFLSVSVCDGTLLEGEADRDNASWARLKDRGVGANLGIRTAGEPGGAGVPSCAAGSLDSLHEIEDLEGSESADAFYGDGGPNQLLGHFGPDVYVAGAGADSILANSGDADPVIDCGDDIDRALVDYPQYGDAAPVNCETVIEAAPNSFQLVPNFPLPTPPPPAVVVKAVRDRTPPRTKIRARPRAVLTTSKARARAVFRFTANESGASFRCKLDRKPYRPCVSPRAYLLAPGRHTVRIFAIDRAGNADRSPALLSLRVRRR